MMNWNRLQVNLLFLLIFLLTFSITLSSRAQEVEGPNPSAEGIYVVQPGDSCLYIVKGILGGSISLQEFHDMNPQLGPKWPHDLVPGSKLRTAPGDPIPDAELTFVRPHVTTRQPKIAEWVPAKEGDPLFRSYRVATAEQATSEVTLWNQTQLQLRENSLLVIYGKSAPENKKDRKTGVELIGGSFQGGLNGIREYTRPLKIGTGEDNGPELGAMSTDLRFEVNDEKTSILSVYDGTVEVESRGVSVKVKDGQGAIVRRGKAPEGPMSLPDAPTWEGDMHVTALVFDNAATSRRLAWTPVEGAEGYYVEVASEPAFRDLHMQQTLPKGSSSLLLEDISAGRYYARVSTVDAKGLHSRPSEPAQIAVVGLDVRCNGTWADGVFHAPWRALFSVNTKDMDVVATVGEQEVVANNIEIFETGRHKVSVRLNEESFLADAFEVDLLEVATEIAIEPEKLEPDGGAINISVTAQATSGPISLKGSRYQVGAEPVRHLNVVEEGRAAAIISVPETTTEQVFPIRVYLPEGQAPAVVKEVIQESPLSIGVPEVAPRLILAFPGDKFEPGFGVGLEAGWLFGKLHRHFLLATDLTYLRFPIVSEGDAPAILAHDATFALNGVYRFFPESLLWSGYVGAGPALVAFSYKGTFSALMAADALAGVEVKAGPGGIFWEARYAITPILLSGDGTARADNFAFGLGYRVQR